MSSFQEYSSRLQGVLADTDWSPVEQLAKELLSCWKDGRQLFICGNGGSAGNAVHIANDFLYGISKTYGSGLRAHALPANTAVITCLANDVGYDEIFSRQLAVQADKDDILIVLSGSGNSPNILKAVETAHSKGVFVIGLTGGNGGKLKDMADLTMVVPSDNTARIQEAHITIGHIICHLVESGLFNESSGIS